MTPDFSLRDTSISPSRLVLIGFRGCGKSVVGHVIAEQLHWHWIDADRELEEQTGRSIADWFSHFGEAAFREAEREVCARLLTREQVVLSLGGGAVLHAETRARLRDEPFVVWLRASEACIVERIGHDEQMNRNAGPRRPRLTDHASLEAEVRHLLAHRTPLYAEVAKRTLDTDNRSVGDLAQEVVRWLATSPHSVD